METHVKARLQLLSIVLACDENYAMPLATTLRSITDANVRHWPLEIYILCDRFNEATKSSVLASLPADSARLNWIQISLDPFSSLKTIPHISRMTFARFLLSDLLPRDLTRALYLDSDLLVLADLGGLWTTNLEHSCVGAVLDHGLDPLLKRQDPRCQGMPLVQDYFNAGVLLIDLHGWRERDIGKKALQYLIEYPNAPYADQDALNAVLDSAWFKLSAEWNFQEHLSVDLSRLSKSERPGIVHFVTAAKPWKRQYHTPNEGLYDVFRRRTKFARSASTRLRDSFKTLWFLTKRSLKRHSLVRAIWHRLALHQ